MWMPFAISTMSEISMHAKTLLALYEISNLYKDLYFAIIRFRDTAFDRISLKLPIGSFKCENASQIWIILTNLWRFVSNRYSMTSSANELIVKANVSLSLYETLVVGL